MEKNVENYETLKNMHLKILKIFFEKLLINENSLF